MQPFWCCPALLVICVGRLYCFLRLCLEWWCVCMCELCVEPCIVRLGGPALGGLSRKGGLINTPCPERFCK